MLTVAWLSKLNDQHLPQQKAIITVPAWLHWLPVFMFEGLYTCSSGSDRASPKRSLNTSIPCYLNTTTCGRVSEVHPKDWTGICLKTALTHYMVHTDLETPNPRTFQGFWQRFFFRSTMKIWGVWGLCEPCISDKTQFEFLQLLQTWETFYMNFLYYSETGLRLPETQLRNTTA